MEKEVLGNYLANVIEMNPGMKYPHEMKIKKHKKHKNRNFKKEKKDL